LSLEWKNEGVINDESGDDESGDDDSARRLLNVWDV